MIDNGYILPPKFSIKELQMTESGRTPVTKECEHLIETIDEVRVNKVLVCARRTAQIVNLIDDTNFCKELSGMRIVLCPNLNVSSILPCLIHFLTVNSLTFNKLATLFGV